MPINVTCPECQSSFLVGDEFAGRPGRCPECTAVIEVPGGDPGDAPPTPEIHVDPFPYQTPRAVEAYEEFPDRARQRREEDERLSHDVRDDYDDQPMERTFDAEARAKAWLRVYKGLGYIQIAVILYFFNQILQSVFMVVHGGINPRDPNALPDSGELAIGAGVAFIMLFAGVFWILGRLSFIKAPYIPARGWAKASFVMVLSSIVSMFGFCCLFVMALGAMGGGPNGGAVAILMLSVMVFLLGMVLVAGGELCGLMALARIGDGLNAPSAANWARMSMVLMLMMMGIMIVGFCGLTIYSAEQQKKKQMQNVNRQNANPPLVQPQADPVVKAKKGEATKDAPGLPKDPPVVQNAPPQQQNPLEDDGLDDTTRIVVNGVMVGLILLYLIQYSIALQKGRRAIRAEIRRLTGETDDRYGHPDEHY